MLSAGMLTDLASAMMVRRRGLASASPPPARAATVSSLMIRVKTLPRFASAAPFLCLIVCHFEWPDMRKLPWKDSENDPLRYHIQWDRHPSRIDEVVGQFEGTLLARQSQPERACQAALEAHPLH